MAEIYMNGETNILDTTNTKNDPVIMDDTAVETIQTNDQQHIKTIIKDGFTNNEKDTKSSIDDNVLTVENDESSDSGINGSYDINDNSEIFNSVVHDETATTTTNNVVGTFDSCSSPILNVDNNVLDKVNSEIPTQETLGISSELNIVDNEQLSDTNIDDKLNTENLDTQIVSSEITVTSITSEITSNNDNDEAVTTTVDKINPSNETTTLHVNETTTLHVNDDVSVTLDTQTNSESAEIDVSSVSESHVKSVDDVPLTESYIKISLDGHGDNNDDDVDENNCVHEASNDVTTVTSSDVVTGETVVKNDSISLDSSNDVSVGLHQDVQTHIPTDNTTNDSSTADSATNEHIQNENITDNNIVIETTKEEGINDTEVSDFVHQVIENAQNEDPVHSVITAENISVLEASPEHEIAEHVPIIDLTENISSVTPVVISDDDGVVANTESIPVEIVDVTEVEIIDDVKSELVVVIDDAKSEVVEIIDDSKSEVVEIVDDSKSEVVEIVDDTKSEVVEIVDDTKSESVEIVDDVKCDVVEIVDVKSEPVVVIDDAEVLKVSDDSKSEVVEVTNDVKSEPVKVIDVPVEIVDDSESVSVEIVDTGKSAAVEVINDVKTEPVKIIDDVKSEPVKIINDVKSEPVKIIDDGKAVVAEVIDDVKSAAVETIVDTKPVPAIVINNTKPVPVEIISDTKPLPIETNDNSVYSPVGTIEEVIPTTETVNISISAPELTPITSSTTAEIPKEIVEEPPEWLDILGNGLLKKKVTLKGNGKETRPLPGNIVTVRCEGRLKNGVRVDKHEKLQFILSDEDVIQAFDLAVALMEDKEVATVFTDARYAYGIHGRSDYTPPIPQNASITYEIEILAIKDGPDLETMSNEERVMYGDKKRIRGNDLYVKEEYAGSINAYKRGIKYLEGTDHEDVMNMKIKCLNNLSAAQLKVKAYKMAIQSLDTVLQFEPENVKALFRKGKCLDGLKKEEEALEYIKKASMLDPQNKSILQELGRLRSRVAVTHQKEKQIYQKMFQPKKEEKISKEEEDLNWSVKITSAVVGVLGIIAGLLWYKHR